MTGIFAIFGKFTFIIIIFALFAGKIASKKGYSFTIFFIIGLILPIIGVAIPMLMKDKN